MAQLAHSRNLFAQKHFGASKRFGIRAALALGHVIRLAVLAPRALRQPAVRERMRAERGALAVLLGVADPPRLGVFAEGES
jgi:hypothetical protein